MRSSSEGEHPSGVGSTDSLECPRARTLLSARLDGELDARAEVALEAHLEACAGCRDDAASLERAAIALRELSPEERARLHDRTYQELGLSEPSSGRRGRLLRVVFFLIMVAVVYFWVKSHRAAPFSVEPSVPAGTSTR